jgi:hypothetical protein
LQTASEGGGKCKCKSKSKSNTLSYPLSASRRNVSIRTFHTSPKDQDPSEDLSRTNIVIAVTGWAETEEEESESDQKYVASVREQVSCLADRIYLSMCSTGVSSCRKTKEKSRKRGLLLGGTSGPSSPSPVHGSRAVVLTALEDPLGATCTHLVCPLPQTAVSSNR